MSFKNYQNTTNYSDRDISKRFNQVEFNKKFEENNNLLNSQQSNLQSSLQSSLLQENKDKIISIDYPHNDSINNNLIKMKNFIFKILNQRNDLFNDISDYFYSGLLLILIGVIILLCMNIFN
jgi:hypothetical protein